MVVCLLNDFLLTLLVDSRASLGDRLELDEDADKIKLAPSAGSREMTFTLPQVK